MSEKAKIINVHDKEGHLLFERYRKVGSGRLLKCFRDEIGVDHTKSQDLTLDQIIYCTQCEPPLAVAVVTMIHGRVAYKIKSSGVPKMIV